MASNSIDMPTSDCCMTQLPKVKVLVEMVLSDLKIIYRPFVDLTEHQ